jgi:hypothetical protein
MKQTLVGIAGNDAALRQSVRRSAADWTSKFEHSGAHVSEKQRRDDGYQRQAAQRHPRCHLPALQMSKEARRCGWRLRMPIR